MVQKISAVVFFFGVLAALQGCNNGVQEMSMTGLCDGYPNYQTSSYVAPWSVGTARTVAQGNCGPASHVGDFKYAVDIGMPIGSTIVAARAGTVYKVVQDKSDGNGCAGGENHIYINHSDGTSAHYLHLTYGGSKVSVGDTVTQGQVIGLSGNTGCSSGPHLHFEVDSDKDSGISIPVTFNNVGVNGRSLIINQSYTPH
jgi:murein DD-endopeptidase MepM/ murein hydrolase activator NlpD